MNFSPFADLEKERLVLRLEDLNNLNEIFEMRSDPEIMKYVQRPRGTTLHYVSEHLKIIQKKD